MLLALQQEPCC